MSRFSPSSPLRRLAFVLVLAAAPMRAASESPTASTNPGWTTEMAQLWQTTGQLAAKGQLAEAVETGEKLAALQQKASTPGQNYTLVTRQWLGAQYERLGDFPKARAEWEKARQAAVENAGENHWWATSAREALKHLDRIEKLSPEQRAQAAEATRLHDDVLKARNSGQLREALPMAKRAYELRSELLGESDPQVFQSLNNLASLIEALGDYEQAGPLYEKALGLCRAIFGEQHPDAIACLNNVASNHYLKARYTEALALYEQSAQAAAKTLGAEHPTTLIAANNIANLYLRLGDYTRAEPLLERTLKIRERTLGPDHPNTATSRNNLALLYQKLGEITRAQELYERTLQSDRKSGNEAQTAWTLHNLASLYDEQGDLARAATLYRDSLALRERVLGPGHPDTANTMNSLGTLLRAMGDYAEAETLLRRGLEARVAALGEDHPDTANSMHNLAAVYGDAGQRQRARELLEKSAAIARRTLGPDHPHTIATLGDLALNTLASGDYAKSGEQLREVLSTARRVFGDTHRETLTALSNLASVEFYAANYSEADRLMRENLQLTKASAGPHHPQTTICYSNLAMVALARSDSGQAAEWCREALANDRHNLQLALGAQSERQQMRMVASLRGDLDLLLSVATGAKILQNEIYEQVLAWKGAVFAQQTFARVGAQRPDIATLLGDLRSVTTRLVSLALSAPDAAQQDAWRRQLDEYGAQKEKLERELSNRSAEYQGERAATASSVANVQRALPENFALVDFLEYSRALPPGGPGQPPRSERSLIAFVLRPAGEVQRIDLGPLAPVRNGVAEWRQFFGAGTAGREAGEGLRRLLWDPLRAALGPATTILISPDGVTSSLPFAALPSPVPSRYLIEDFRILLLPVPQRLPHLVSTPAPGGEPSLLLIGDVDYNAAESNQPDVSSRPAPFAPLPGTAQEIAAVEKLFSTAFPKGRHDALSGGKASKQAFTEAAPTFSHVVLATHGFFAASPNRTTPTRDERTLTLSPVAGQVAARHPGLLSGIALAGANRTTSPAAESATSAGILASLEVSTLDLRGVNLAVLSACESGLGVAESGEGVLGLQRAFQMGGARSTITSLWAVHDDATRELMTRFFHCLWTEKQSKLDAFRAAQLWMLRNYRKTGTQQRGLVAERPEDVGGTLSPYYWASFVLAGDWR